MKRTASKPGLTLPEASEIMTAQGGEQVDGYKLENLELEYETIEKDSLASEVSSLYTSGRSLSYKHVTLMRVGNWDKDLTIVNENINIPCKEKYVSSCTTVHQQ